ncbi:hypothetical protein B0H66DRAFT_43569 [Apodospora peruviana]|uniref:FAD-binding PCMH-type domain-containing protein n=1 Tax=Apodospora peruviana TaxID=516989 RepID=A0AAE0IRY6_9PEZI|nr:hypothetical protein B0H66DRAFT_43569 [Apodospora peruviana]
MLGLRFLYAAIASYWIVLVTTAAAGNSNHPPGPHTPDIKAELGPLLSRNAQIITPSSPHFGEFTERYLLSNSPEYSVVVVVDTEDDVSKAVKYANAHKIPFAAKNTGHGSWGSLATMKGGMNIWMRNLSKIELSLDGQYATVGGGVRIADLVQTLWSARKQTATGLCQCIGVTGSSLGGGVGPIQGEYGLGLDQIVSARVVLADGTAVTASEQSHPELFWGLKGAGHNFGIVTEMKMRVHSNQGKEKWTFTTLIYTQDKLEAVFEQLNVKLATQPAHLSWETIITRDPTTDPDNAILILWVFSNGLNLNAMDKYTKPLRDIGPVAVNTIITDYPGLIEALGYGLTSESCKPNHYGGVFGIGVTRYIPSDLRSMYNLFNQITSEVPEFASSYAFVENYAPQAMQAVPARSTAYAHRHFRALPTIVLLYDAPAAVPALDAKVTLWGEKMRTALMKHQQREESYVNYAVGEQESLEALYGYDGERQQKLRRLKKQYDPYNRFWTYGTIE